LRRAARTETPPPNLDALALFAGEDAEAVVFYFVQQAGSGWRIDDERRFARADEADRRISRQRGAGVRQTTFMARTCNASPALTRICVV
jgi:hypothetical protein